MILHLTKCFCILTFPSSFFLLFFAGCVYVIMCEVLHSFYFSFCHSVFPCYYCIVHISRVHSTSLFSFYIIHLNPPSVSLIWHPVDSRFFREAVLLFVPARSRRLFQTIGFTSQGQLWTHTNKTCMMFHKREWISIFPCRVVVKIRTVILNK